MTNIFRYLASWFSFLILSEHPKEQKANTANLRQPSSAENNIFWSHLELFHVSQQVDELQIVKAPNSQDVSNTTTHEDFDGACYQIALSFISEAKAGSLQLSKYYTQPV